VLISENEVLQVDELGKVQKHVGLGQNLLGFAWRPKDFDSVEAVAFFDHTVTGETRQNFLGPGNAVSGAFETETRKKEGERFRMNAVDESTKHGI
jgi:hypothetical protein